MALYKDQLGRTVELNEYPKRIVSVVPSQTELLFDLGLDYEVVGITKFCVHPDSWFRIKTRVGGTKQLNLDKIRELKPELIIANKEENVQEQIEELEKEFPVWVSDVNNLTEAVEMIVAIGQITNKDKAAIQIVSNIEAGFYNLKEVITHPYPRTCYLIWKEPYMTVGGDTFISNMMQYAGFENMFKDQKRYPEITIEELKNSKCKVLLLSSEPYPFKQKHIDELNIQLPDTKILLVDGEMFSWYGSRLKKSPSYFEQLQRQALSVF